jgi:hypothetical protein
MLKSRFTCWNIDYTQAIGWLPPLPLSVNHPFQAQKSYPKHQKPLYFDHISNN